MNIRGLIRELSGPRISKPRDHFFTYLNFSLTYFSCVTFNLCVVLATFELFSRLTIYISLHYSFVSMIIYIIIDIETLE